MITLLAILGWLAFVGGVILFFQLVLMIFFGHHGDFTPSDVDVTGHDVDGHDNSVDGDGGVKIFSLLGISSFLLMFGLSARYFIITLFFHWSVALVVATVFGLIMMYAIGYVFYKVKKLESDGTVHLANAVNSIGTVYLPFYEDIVGTVQININGIMHECDAMSYNPSDYFKVGDSIKVVEVQGNFVKVVKNN